MAYPPTTINVSYGVSSSVLLNIPSGVSYGDYVAGIMRNGVWFPQNPTANPPSTITFIPAGQITGIVAQ